MTLSRGFVGLFLVACFWACSPSGGSEPRPEPPLPSLEAPVQKESEDAANEGLPERASERPELVSEGRLDTTPEPTALRSCKQNPSYGQPCPLSTKDCSAFGRWLCAPDGRSLRCHLSEDNACDGKDNDCDGKIDEDCPSLLRSFATQGLFNVEYIENHSSGDLLLFGRAVAGGEIQWDSHRATLPTTEGRISCLGWWASRLSWNKGSQWLLGGASSSFRFHASDVCQTLPPAGLFSAETGDFFLKWQITHESGTFGALEYGTGCSICLLMGHYDGQGQLQSVAYKEQIGSIYPPVFDPQGTFYNLYGGRHFSSEGFLEKQTFEGTLLHQISAPCGVFRRGQKVSSTHWLGTASIEKGPCQLAGHELSSPHGGTAFLEGKLQGKLEHAFLCQGKAEGLWWGRTAEGHRLAYVDVEAEGLFCPSFDKPLQQGRYLLRWDGSWTFLWSLPLEAIGQKPFFSEGRLALDPQGRVWALEGYTLLRISEHGELLSSFPFSPGLGGPRPGDALLFLPNKGIVVMGSYRRDFALGRFQLPDSPEDRLRLFLALFPIP